jgi:actin-like ATPase involved in cell morphogenesis
MGEMAAESRMINSGMHSSSDSLGLSIGIANLVAARVGSPPVSRRSVLTLFGHRPPEVGTPDENPNLTEPGLVLQGFTERVGDPTPFVAADGSTHRSDVLAAEALDAVARNVNYGAPVAVAVPAHWREASVVALREALRSKPALAPNGVPPALISDATAALAALYAKPGFPTDGMVVLCDFGAGGTSVTLTDAASNFRQIGETVRYTDFSGEWVDQAILRHLQSHGASADNDGAKTAPVGSLARRLDQCRRAKEQLSAATVAVVPAEMPGVGQDVRLSRAEFEEMISEPLDRFLATVEQILQRNEVPAAKLAAIATVGGGACTPLITHRLSERLRVPVVTTPTPMLSAAIGAAVLGQQRFSASRPPAMGVGGSAPTAVDATVSAPPAGGAATERADAGMRPAFDPGAPPGFDAPIPTDMAPSAWAANAALAAADESSVDGAESATYRALAWSQDPNTGEEPLPYTGEDHSGEYSPSSAASPAAVQSVRTQAPPPVTQPDVRTRFKGSPMLFVVAAIAAIGVLAGAAVLAVKISTANTKPTNSTSKVTTPSRPPTTRPAPPPVVTVTETQGTTETSIVTPPPSTVVTTTTQPPSTTTSRPPTTTPTTTRPTTPYLSPPMTSSPPPITNPAIPIYPGPATTYGP